MVRNGWVVAAIDFSPRAVSLAQKVAGQGSGAELAVADARAMPFRNGLFDAVSACHVLGHGQEAERRKMAAELCRAMKPGGQLWFRDFSTRDFRYGAGRETEPGSFVRGSGILTHYFTGEEVASLFAPLDLVSSCLDEWSLRVRGKDHRRSEIAMHFIRP
jgi:ubiquinone/menaquinone biosynthesis C-methylase UbiE